MPDLPAALLHSLEDAPGFNKEAFEKVHASNMQVTSIRMNPAKYTIAVAEEEAGDDHTTASGLRTRVPWSANGYYLPERPSFTFDPLFHSGTYYVQEASSMFLEQGRWPNR